MKRSNILSSALVKNTLKLTSGSILQYCIPLAITPVLSRLFTPEEYGEWGVFSSYVIVLTVLASGGYSFAIVKTKRNSDACNLVALSLLFVIIVSILILGIIGLAGICNWTYISTLPMVWMIPFYVFISSFAGILLNYANYAEKYSLIAFSSVFSGLDQAALRILFGIVKLPVNGLIAGTNIALTVDSLFLLFKTRIYSSLKKFFSFKQIRILAVENRKFPLYDMPSTLLNYMSSYLPIVILAYFFSKEDVGCFSMVIQILLLPMAFIGSAMGNVYYKQLSVQNDNGGIADLSMKVFKGSFVLGLLPILFFILGGDLVLFFFLGSKWKTAGDFALYLSLWSWLTIVFTPLLPIFRIKNKQNILMVLNVVMFAVRISLVYFGSKYIDSIGIIISLYSVVSALFWLVEGYVIIRLCGIELRSKIFIGISLASVVVLGLWLVKTYSLLM